MRQTYQLLSDARTFGVFQLESQGLRDILRKLKPSVFEDVIALVALVSTWSARQRHDR